MAVCAIRSRNNLGSAITDRNPSPNIWADCPWEGIVEGFVAGAYIYDDFVVLGKTVPTTAATFGDKTGFTSTNGTFAVGTGLGGELILGSSSGSDNDAMSIATRSTPFLINRATGQFWFEARVKVSSIANTICETFLGLIEDVAATAIIPITTTAASLADQNLVGFYRTESAGASINTTYKANGVTAVTVGSAEGTLVADTYTKLGMRLDLTRNPFVGDPNLTGANSYLLTFYKDNVKLATSKQLPLDTVAGTDFPNDVGMGLILAQRYAAGSIQPSTTIDWWRAAQVFIA